MFDATFDVKKQRLSLSLVVLATLAACNDSMQATKPAPVAPDPRFKNISSLLTPVPIASHSVTVQQDKLCPPDDERLLAEARDAFKSLRPSQAATPDKSVLIQGVTVTGAPDLIATAKTIVSEKPPKAWKRGAQFCKGTAKDVICMIGQLFGSEEAAYRIFNIASRSGYVISATQVNNPATVEQVYSLREIRMIEQVLLDLPAKFQNLPSMNQFERVADGYAVRGDEKSIAWAVPRYSWRTQVDPGRILILGTAFTYPQPEITIAHELAHHLDFSTQSATGYYLNDSSGFAAINGWTTTADPSDASKKTYAHGDGGEFVTDYAATSPLEDFAEAVAYYIYRPSDLEKHAPRQYALISSGVFDGQSFKSLHEWTQVADLISRDPYVPNVAASCLKAAASISMSYTSKDAWFNLIPSTSNNPMEVSAFIEQTGCASSYSDQIRQKVMDLPEFCSMGGISRISSELARQSAPVIQNLLKGVGRTAPQDGTQGRASTAEINAVMSAEPALSAADDTTLSSIQKQLDRFSYGLRQLWHAHGR